MPPPPRPPPAPGAQGLGKSLTTIAFMHTYFALAKPDGQPLVRPSIQGFLG